MTTREVISRLQREEWTSRPGKGAHIVFRKPGFRNVVVSSHRGDIGPGALRDLCKVAGWTYPPET